MYIYKNLLILLCYLHTTILYHEEMTPEEIYSHYFDTDDLKKLDIKEKKILAKDIRNYILDIVSISPSFLLKSLEDNE
mgnify:CR=1 FL=1